MLVVAVVVVVVGVVSSVAVDVVDVVVTTNKVVADGVVVGRAQTVVRTTASGKEMIRQLTPSYSCNMTGLRVLTFWSHERHSALDVTVRSVHHGGRWGHKTIHRLRAAKVCQFHDPFIRDENVRT
jgi:hypothetical protein